MSWRKNAQLLLFLFLLITIGCRDRCETLPACEQYECRNPQFYCAGVLNESNKTPRDILTAKEIVRDYMGSEGRTGKIGGSSQSPAPYFWFLVDVNFSDGSSRGYEVGPDGNIYEIKRRN